MLTIGIISEGPTDALVIERVVRLAFADVRVLRIQPNPTLATGFPNGWKGVRAWCRKHGPVLTAFMGGVTPVLDLLVVHVDCSMAHNESIDVAIVEENGAATPRDPSDIAEELRRIVIKRWFGLPQRPNVVVLATPSKSTDAWVVASLNPPVAGLDRIEYTFEVENELARRKLLKTKDGVVKKNQAAYERLLDAIGSSLDAGSNVCGEARVFRRSFAAEAGRVLQAGGTQVTATERPLTGESVEAISQVI